MSVSLNTNVGSLIMAVNFNRNAAEMDKISQQISTGKRILSSADDPAGMAIAATLTAQKMSYNAVAKNLTAGQSLLGVADTALNNQQQLLQQMKDLATQASSDLLTVGQRTALQGQFVELQKQLDDTVNKANMFGQNLVSAAAASVNIQSGVNAGDTTTVATAKSDASTLGLNAAAVDLTTSAKASAAMTAIDTAVNTVSSNQAIIGAQIQGLKATQNYTETVSTNLQNTISSIEDANIPKLSSQLSQLQTKQQLMAQTLGISNQMPQYLLALLR